MNEYEISFQIEVGIIFKKSKKGFDIVQADSADEAMKKWDEEYKSEVQLIKREGGRLSMLGIRKI